MQNFHVVSQGQVQALSSASIPKIPRFRYVSSVIKLRFVVLKIHCEMKTNKEKNEVTYWNGVADDIAANTSVSHTYIHA